MKKELEEALKQVVEESVITATKSPNANNRIAPIHKFFGDLTADLFGEDYRVFTLLREGGELKYKGAHDEVFVDLGVQNKKLFTVPGEMEFKMVVSCYDKNARTYFKNLQGEVTNFRRAGTVCFEVLALPLYSPTYKKGKLVSIRFLKDEDIARYRRLVEWDYDETCNPNNLLIISFDMGNLDYLESHLGKKIQKKDLVKSYKITLPNVDSIETVLLPENKRFLKEHSDPEDFVKKFYALTIVNEMQSGKIARIYK